MSDVNSSLPVRTQTNGDVVAQIADGTTPSQKLLVTSTGHVAANTNDGAGTAITSTTIVAKQALDVNVANTITTSSGVADESSFTFGSSNQQPVGGVFSSSITALTSGQSGAFSVTAQRDLRVNLRTSAGVELGNTAATKLFVQQTDGTNNQAFTAAGEAKVDVTAAAAYGSVAGGTAGTLSDLAGGVFNTAAPTLTNGQQASLQLNTSGALKVDASATTQPVSGTVAVTQSTSPWIGKDQSDGPVTPGAVASFSQLAGGQFNTSLPTLTTGQQAAVQLDSSGRVIISPLTSIAVTNLPTTVDTNFGTVGASTLRGAAQIGNTTGAADFNAGATGAQTLRVVANQGAANATPWNQNIAQIAGASPSASNGLPVQISLGTSFISSSNPLPVTIDTVIGTSINDPKDASAIAAAASDNHDYTVTALKTLTLDSVSSAASGKAKMIIAIETGVASGTFTTKFVQFNSTANTNMYQLLTNPIQVAAGVRVRVTMTNLEGLLAQDLYSTISGSEA